MRKQLGADWKSADGIVVGLKVSEDLKGTSKYVLQAARFVSISGCKTPYGVVSERGANCDPMAWVFAETQRFKTRLNRLVRTRMLGGVGGAR